MFPAANRQHCTVVMMDRYTTTGTWGEGGVKLRLRVADDLRRRINGPMPTTGMSPISTNLEHGLPAVCGRAVEGNREVGGAAGLEQGRCRAPQPRRLTVARQNGHCSEAGRPGLDQRAIKEQDSERWTPRGPAMSGRG